MSRVVAVASGLLVAANLELNALLPDLFHSFSISVRDHVMIRMMQNWMHSDAYFSGINGLIYNEWLFFNFKWHMYHLHDMCGSCTATWRGVLVQLLPTTQFREIHRPTMNTKNSLLENLICKIKVTDACPDQKLFTQLQSSHNELVRWQDFLWHWPDWTQPLGDSLHMEHCMSTAVACASYCNITRLSVSL